MPLVQGWIDGINYEGTIVVHRGSTYQALRDTAQAPGKSQDWACLAQAGAHGQDGRSFNIRETWDAHEKYAELDVVTLNSTWFIARQDDPGPCPGPGWKAGPTGKRGDKGERGERGMPGEAGLTIIAWELTARSYMAVPVMSDGSKGPALDLRPVFEQFQLETR